MSESETAIQKSEVEGDTITNGVGEDSPPTANGVEEENPATNGDEKPDTCEPTANGVDEVKPTTNGTENANEKAKDDKVAEKGPMKTVNSVVARLKNDTSISDSDKIDTLCLLVQRIVEENSMLKGEIEVVGEQCEKQREAKEAIKTLNEAYKKQIDLVREESKLRLQEEQSKRQAGMGGYTNTMTELSSLLETHTEQNNRLREQNTGMAEKMGQLIGDAEKRDEFITKCQTEAQLQITLLQHQVQKAQIEKAELKADMTKERLELSQELLLERERTRNLDETVRILREQAEIYQHQMEELQEGAGSSKKSFQHFKTQIDKLTSSMGALEKDTALWRQKYEVSSGQVKKMNTTAMEKENEVAALKKKLDSMVKLNKTLSAERTSLMKKLKQADA